MNIRGMVGIGSYPDQIVYETIVYRPTSSIMIIAL